MERRKFLGALSLAGVAGALSPKELLAGGPQQPAVSAPAGNDREYWWQLLYKIADPVVANLAAGTLVKNMPVEKSPTFDKRSAHVTYLEAVGRTYAGIAPWLALTDDVGREGEYRQRMRTNAVKGLVACFTPGSADALNFKTDYQPIVDAAYLAQTFLRAPKVLWEPLPADTKTHIITAFKSLRNRKPFNSNWLLFGSLTEAFLLSVGEEPDAERLEKGITKMAEWYKGDGWYGDGPNLAFDYYNSFVIHPMLVDTLAVLARHQPERKKEYDLAVKRMQRYALEQERMISPEGTFPPIGRSITYRTGAFQALSQIALMELLPKGIEPAQVRSALTLVKKNMYGAKGTFGKDNWLNLGFVGHDPQIADYYTSTGSLYMATLSFLPLGLPAGNPFWAAPAAEWSAKKAWAGKNFEKDYHVDY
ncbi:DUF2264 domain-containing protein [Chitinophaga lutea]|uniref:DUF2264 domain-containing protein n=1 Tax=Chitinophaga lutea TaxID=2488634 RepID=A0A3N4PTI1_9BACT|nr:DUF2264 domain-containing protein [Chitinophaga lutea]RPE08321.1 DUF2264 domain-containing protein [Chitinophaga lutea]